MGAVQRLRDYFTLDDADDGASESALDTARVIIEFANSRYWPVLDAWLTAEGTAPSAIAEHVAMIAAATRRNTLLEIRAKITRDIGAATETLERERG